MSISDLNMIIKARNKMIEEDVEVNNRYIYTLASMTAYFVNRTFNGKKVPSYEELKGESDYRVITEQFKAFADANNRRRQNDNRTT